MITRERLLEVLQYCPETGVFTWKVDKGSARVGDKAGGFSGGDGNNGYYIRISVDGESYYAHQLAWFLTYNLWVKGLDHKDLNKANNSINNLRSASAVQNSGNTLVRKRNSLGVKGVRKRTKNCYEVRIGKNIIGYFSSLLGAKKAYQQAALEYFGEYARAE